MRLLNLWRPIIFSVLFILCLTLTLYSQDADPDDGEDDADSGVNIESDWSRAANLYTTGDQVFCISLGVVKPLFFVEKEEGYLKTQMKMGGMGSLGYNYFLGPNFFLGGELSGTFCATLGQNMFYLVPIGFRAGYQFLWDRFEFPLSMTLGFALQSYNQQTYFGIFAKPAAGAFYRFNSEWSFGLNTSFWWVPEWTGKTREWNQRDSKINIHGFFWEISAGARYHF